MRGGLQARPASASEGHLRAEADDARALHLLWRRLRRRAAARRRDDLVVAPEDRTRVRHVERVGGELEAEAARDPERLRHAQVELEEVVEAVVFEVVDDVAAEHAVETLAAVEAVDVALPSGDDRAEVDPQRRLIETGEAVRPARVDVAVGAVARRDRRVIA